MTCAPLRGPAPHLIKQRSIHEFSFCSGLCPRTCRGSRMPLITAPSSATRRPSIRSEKSARHRHIRPPRLSRDTILHGIRFGYGITPHLTVNAFFPATFSSGALPESRMIAGSEWSAGASWRFQHSVTSVGKRIESTASLGLVVPGPQRDSGLLSQPPSGSGCCRLSGHGPCFAKSVRLAGWWLHALCARPRTINGRTRFRGAPYTATARLSSDEAMTNGTIAGLPS